VKSAPAISVAPVFDILPGSLRRLGFISEALRNPLEFFLRIEREYGGVVALTPGRFHLVSHPEGVKRVLQDNHPNYTKGTRYRQTVGLAMGNGLIVSEGDFWMRQRRLVQPAFQRKNHPDMAGVMADSIAEVEDRWERLSLEGATIDVREEMTHLTLDILLRAVFGTRLDDRGSEIFRVVAVAEETMNLTSAYNPLRLPKWVPTPANLHFKSAMRTLDRIVYGLVEERRRSGAGSEDLLALLINARDTETGESMNSRQVRDEIVTMLFAGHDTTSDALTWTWYLLAKHPEAGLKASAEAKEVCQGRPRFDDLPKLVYTSNVLNEAMRLYPPGWAIGRVPARDDEICGFHIPAGSMVVLSAYVTQHSARWWPDPERFDPDRFLPQNAVGRPRFALYPFGGGPRLCIGMGMAMMEMQLIIAILNSRFRLEMQPGPEVKPRGRVSLTQDRPVLMRIHRR
jgi:cytochrome P450